MELPSTIWGLMIRIRQYGPTLCGLVGYYKSHSQPIFVKNVTKRTAPYCGMAVDETGAERRTHLLPMSAQQTLLSIGDSIMVEGVPDNDRTTEDLSTTVLRRSYVMHERQPHR